MSMTTKQLRETIAEAERFLRKAKALREDMIARENDCRARESAGEREAWWNLAPSPRDTGAARRASMDLTRSLADLRRA